jgi:hypothetical protein
VLLALGISLIYSLLPNKTLITSSRVFADHSSATLAMDNSRFLKKINDLAGDEKYTAAAQAFIEVLAEERINQYREKAKEVKALAATFAAAAPTPAGPPPAVLLAAMEELRTESIKFVDGLNALRNLIIVRTPEIKEEDNAGVAIQMAFAELVDGYSDVLTGAGGKKDSSGGGLSLVPIGFKKDYLAARVAAEEKVLGRQDKEETDGGSSINKQTPSSLAALAQVDTEACFKVSNGFYKLHQASLLLVVGFTRNANKILNPRRTGSSMIG